MNTGTTRIQQWKNHISGVAAATIEWIKGPRAGVEPSQRRRLRLLSAFLIVMGLMTLSGAVFVKNISISLWTVMVITSLLLFIGYFISRTRYYQIAVILAITVPAINPLAVVIFKLPEISVLASLIWLALPLLVSSLMMKVQKTLIVASFYLAIIFILGFFGSLDNEIFVPLIAYILIIAFFVITVSVVREKDHAEIENKLKERQQAEKALRESEEKFRNLFENAKDTIILADTQTGKIIDVNTAGCKLLGLPKEKIIGMDQIELHPPEMADKYKQLFHDHIQKGVVITEDIVVQRADGVQIPIDISASVVKLADKTIIQGIFRDITERVRMAKVIRDSEERFTKVFRLSPLEIWIARVKDGKIVEINDSFTRISGFTREETIGRTSTELGIWTKPEDRQKILKLLDINGRVHNEEFEFRNKNGEIRTHLFSAEPINFNGEECIIPILTDITERKQMEKALKESEEKFSKAFLHSPEVIVISNIEDGAIFEASDTFLRLTGYTREEVIGKKKFELGVWAVPEERTEAVKILKERGIVSNRECQFRMKSGEIRTWLFSAEIINIDNKPCMLSVTTDITERKRSEMELVSAQGKLKEAYRLAHIGTWDLVIESDTATWSEELYNIAGWDPSRKNIPAAELPGLYTADSWSLLNDAITKAIATGEPYNLELQIIRPDGSLRWVNEFGGVMRDRNGKVIGLHGTLQDVTERKRAEEKLQESEEKFSKAFRSSPDAIVISTLKDGVFIEVNDSFTHFIGYTREELIGHTSTEFETWARAEDRTRMLRILKKKGRVNNEEYNFRTRSGELRTWLFSAELIDIGGEPCLLSVNTDITERKQAEAAVRESEEKYRAIFEQGADSIVIIEEEPMRIVDFNDKAHENLGYTREEFVKVKLGKINAAGGTEKVRQNIEEIHKKGILVFEEKQLTKSGEIRDVLISSKSLNIGGRWLQMGIWHDITEQKRAEEKIRLNERHVQDLLDLHRMTDATEKSILDHVLDSSNRSLRSQFAFIGLMSADEAVMTVHAWSKEAMKQYAITEKPIHFPIANAGLWGEAVRQRRPIIVNDYNTSKEYKKGYPKEHVTIKRFLSVPIFSDDKIVAVGAVANKVSEYDETDVSVLTSLLHEMWNLIERRRDEEKLKQAMVELESSGTKLQATNKELESFSYSVSHDLRSPLRSIDGFSQALLEDYLDRLDEKGQDYLKRLRVASQKMGELIDGLLKLSRLTRSEMRHEKVDLSTLANEISARLQETNPHSHAKFVIGSDLGTYGDPQMLRVLLENLLGNAWKFTRKTRRAEIEFGITGNGAKKTFFIKDNGAGFDMAYKDKLFGAFQRLHDTTEFPGTGIGLATVLRIINRHGGSIRAEGAVGKGATFYFNLD